jgi:hypothetical protein
MNPYDIDRAMRRVLVIGLVIGMILGWLTANIVWINGGYNVVR